ncbi:MAG: hypothetical protein IKY12_03415, partial [Clostridia bacterium]|nr:hypothetical protein [Clostridia bacterium]
SMVVHPNSNSILQMNIGTNELLEFDNSIKEYKSEIFKFMWLGLFGYAISIYGIINIILIYKKKYAGKSNNK